MGSRDPNKKKEVVIVALNSTMLVVFAGPTDVFVNANKLLAERGINDGYDIHVVAATAEKQIDSETGMSVVCRQNAMEINTPIDTLIVAGIDSRPASKPGLKDFYNWLSARGEHNTRRIASVCGGAFALARAGLLKGRRATTHWERAEALSKEFPEIQVNCEPMFTRDGNVYTAAGGSSGIDLALALVEEDFGKELAARVAKRIVFFLSRPGYQSQFGDLLPAYNPQHIAQQTRVWLSEHLHEDMDVGQMADHMNMSVRNFSRVFHKQTGMPPAKFIEKLRVETARKYLEDTDITLERIAKQCGLGGLVNMRRTFLRHLMTTPSDYRRSFRTALNNPGMDDLLASAAIVPADTA